MENITIKISEVFSITPGPRYKDEGRFSGEEFREHILEKAYSKAIKENKKLIVNLDGTLGYGTSFLEEVFGGIARKYGKDNLKKILLIISQEEPYLKDDIEEYITKA